MGMKFINRCGVFHLKEIFSCYLLMETKKIISILFFSFIATGFVLFAIYRREVNGFIKSLTMYTKDHLFLASIVYILGFGVISCFMVPISFVTMIAGIVFKPLYIAVIIALLGSQFGILLSFMMGKSLLRPHVIKMFDKNKKVKALDNAIKNEGFKVVSLLRMTPVFPFGFCNYFLSGTGLHLRTVMLASLIGNIPGAVMNSFLGALLSAKPEGDTSHSPPRIKYLLLLFTAVVTIGTFSFIGVVAKKALRGVVDLERLEEGLDSQPPSPVVSENSLDDAFSSDASDTVMIEFVQPDTTKYSRNEKRLLYFIVAACIVSISIGVPLIIYLTPEI